MSNTRAVIIYWGGHIIQTESGPNVENASSMVNFIDNFNLQGLHNLIRNAVGINDAWIIKKIVKMRCLVLCKLEMILMLGRCLKLLGSLRGGSQLNCM